MVNHEKRETSVIKLTIRSTLMIRSNLCDYSDAYVHLKETITVSNTGTVAAPNDKKSNI